MIAETIQFCQHHKLSFFPVAHNKRPVTKWGKYQSRYPTQEDTEKWTKYAEGFAVVTGRLSGIVILDVDCKNGKNGFDSLQGKQLPPTPTVRTPSGGTHYYYKYPGKKVVTKQNILPGVDIRGDGGYALIPNTPGYEWYDGMKLGEIPLADIPDWLFELVLAPLKKKRVPSNEYTLLGTPTTDTPKIVPAGSLNKALLRQWYSSEDATLLMAHHMGIPATKIGEGFRCILPGEPDHNPSASLYRGDNGVIVYRDWRDSEPYYTLPEVRASLAYKGKVKLRDNNAEHATWGIRLLIESGLLNPVFVEHRSLPPKCKKSIQRTYEGFLFLLGCKWLYDNKKPTPFSRRFAVPWCGVGERQAGDAIKWLLQQEYIEKVDTYKQMGLFLPKLK